MADYVVNVGRVCRYAVSAASEQEAEELAQDYFEQDEAAGQIDAAADCVLPEDQAHELSLGNFVDMRKMQDG